MFFLYQCSILEKNPTVNEKNKPLIIETLRQIAELMIWGDQNNDNFFFFLAEKNILGNFLRIVRQKYDRDVTIQVLQTLSIMIQNISKQMSLYYLFSNNYINDMVVHDFDFMDNEILAYYISFLKTISLKLDRDVINFFFNAKAHGVCFVQMIIKRIWIWCLIYVGADFPLYSEALKFFKHKDQMVRIAVRTLTLNVFRVNDPDLRKYITDKTAVPYFSNIVWFMKDQCFLLNEFLHQASVASSLQHPLEENVNPSPASAQSQAQAQVGATAKEETSSSHPSMIQNSGGAVESSNKMIRTQIQQGVEEQVDHYYYLEVDFVCVYICMYLCIFMYTCAYCAW
ncbi:protein CLEC16A [Reticulomyxa filosa]|uniref:Protein CLEC16A n=1 Tax=Reticulomyxa filosa TaxID=46433 RepID=X6N427_RETFI|nr:protein CLEC16A [Reticulomyxa filosa]|eukprot:ETO20786.1 protein CLEC16A [Reticulomyxa filosa]